MPTMKIVQEIIDERGDGHGWWYFLKPGWKRQGYEYHSLRADTKKEINRQLRDEVVPCNCADCVAALKEKTDD